MKIFAFASCFGLLLIGTLNGQEVSRFSFDLGAGFTEPVGNTANYLNNNGWNLQAASDITFHRISA
jgi:hypothetical protein